MELWSSSGGASLILVLILVAPPVQLAAPNGGGAIEFGCGAQHRTVPPPPLPPSTGGTSPNRRHRRDIFFPEPDAAAADTMAEYFTQEEMDDLNDADTLEDISRIIMQEPEVVALRRSELGSKPLGQAKSEYSTQHSVLSRTFSGGQTRQQMSSQSAILKAVPAKCKPMLQPVPLTEVTTPSSNVLYLPTCILLERCSGCCSNALTSCQPTKTEKVLIEVLRLVKTSRGVINNGSEFLEFEKHVSCGCPCRVRAENCNAVQVYSNKECKCTCPNLEEERKCRLEVKKCWDKQDCTCRCRNPPEPCTTGNEFDKRSCQCRSRRRHTAVPLSTRKRTTTDDDAITFGTSFL